VTLPGSPPVTTAFGPYPDTPTWSGTLYGELKAHATSEMEVSLRAELYDQTKSYFSSTNNTLSPGTELPGYAVTNFRLGLEDLTAGWSAGVIVKNAFNRVYYVGGVPSYNVFTYNTALPGDPRTVIGEVHYKF
jgi:iron complex outermembrane receptor protein